MFFHRTCVRGLRFFLIIAVNIQKKQYVYIISMPNTVKFFPNV